MCEENTKRVTCEWCGCYFWRGEPQYLYGLELCSQKCEQAWAIREQAIADCQEIYDHDQTGE